MAPYLVLLAVVTTLAYFGRDDHSALKQNLSFLLVFVCLVCFAGLRDYHVGTDTGNYVYSFYRSSTFASATNIDMEIGYVTLVWLARQLSDNYAVLLSMVAAIYVFFHLLLIRKYISNFDFGVYLFIVLGAYTTVFNPARQAIAVAICFWAIQFILDRRLLPYVASVAVAALFHKTAVVVLPLYFLASSELRLTRILWLGVAVLVSTAFIRVFVGWASAFLDDRFGGYAAQGRGGGEVVVAYLTGQAILFFLLRNRVKADRELYNALCNIYLIALVPALVTIIAGINPSGILRLTRYFSGAAILIWPILFREIRLTRQYELIGTAFFVVTLGYFILTTTSFSNLVPYYLNSGYPYVR